MRGRRKGINESPSSIHPSRKGREARGGNARFSGQVGVLQEWSGGGWGGPIRRTGGKGTGAGRSGAKFRRHISRKPVNGRSEKNERFWGKNERFWGNTCDRGLDQDVGGAQMQVP